MIKKWRVKVGEGTNGDSIFVEFDTEQEAKECFKKMLIEAGKIECDHEKDHLGMCKYCRKQIINPEKDE